MIIKKSILQKYMYLMFWIFYGTVLLAPFEHIIDDNTFRSKSSDDRKEYLNKYEKELDNLRRVSDEINIKKWGRSDELPDPFTDSNSRRQMQVSRVDDARNTRIQELQERLKELKIIHDQKELQLFVNSDRFQPIEQELKSHLGMNDDLMKKIKQNLAGEKTSLDAKDSQQMIELIKLTNELKLDIKPERVQPFIDVFLPVFKEEINALNKSDLKLPIDESDHSLKESVQESKAKVIDVLKKTQSVLDKMPSRLIYLMFLATVLLSLLAGIFTKNKTLEIISGILLAATVIEALGSSFMQARRNLVSRIGSPDIGSL